MSPRLFAAVPASLALALALGLASCAPAPARAATPPGPAATASAVTGLPPNGQFDYQIGGPYAPVASVAVVARDRHEVPVGGRYNVCYVNAFQTQPEDKAFWTGQHPDLLVRKSGRPVTDPDWPGEYLLDTSTAAKRTRLLAIVGPWLDGCHRSGFTAVEPDNLDSWTRSKGVLTKAHNVAFAMLLAERAHGLGLAIAQKNTAELGRSGKDVVGFDFAIVEECQVYDECAAYTDVYGDQLVEIEYTDNPRSAYTAACAARGARISVILRDRDVVPRGTGGYRYEYC